VEKLNIGHGSSASQTSVSSAGHPMLGALSRAHLIEIFNIVKRNLT